MNTDNEQVQKRSDLIQSAKVKKKIVIIFISMIVFVTLFLVLSSLIDFENLINKLNSSSYNPTKQTIIFFTPDYDENIFENPAYMELDRNIYIYDISTGVTESLEQEDYEEYGDDIKFMVTFINSIINGDSAAYNKSFSEDCINNGFAQEKEMFTMQQLYNIIITRISKNEELEDDNNYTKYEVALEYMIRNNNGTFRTDIGSDASKKQYITMTDKNGELLIDKIITPSTK